MTYSKQTLIPFVSSCFLALLIGCGGSSSPDTITIDQPTYTVGVYQDDALFKNRCAAPRTGTDLNGDPFPDQAGSILHENHFLRSWSNDTYLWYAELPDLNPADHNDPIEYFDLLKTDAITNSGNLKDNFHFTQNTAEYKQSTQTGVSLSYGIDFLLTSSQPPRALFIRYIEPGSPADAAELNLTRGVEILEIDGVSVETGSTQQEVDTLNAGLFPSTDGESHTFTILDIGATVSREVTIQATEVTKDPVPIAETIGTANGNVGYMLFKTHNFVSEDKLFDAMTQFSNDNVTDLVLDLRYNGGGLLYIASQLSYMIAGSTATAGKTFDETRFNDKHTVTNPVTGQQLAPTPFYNGISQYSDKYAENTPLPALDLNRVFILSTGRTCSASEAIINGLRGIDVEVILIGDTTCGKPYGFYPTDNCGTTYFTIQFEGVNDKGFGEYSDGFTPMNAADNVGVLVPGCEIGDDLTAQLGDQAEPMYAAALSYRNTGSCPVARVAQTKANVIPDNFGKQGTKDSGTISLPPELNQKLYVKPHKD